jgi:hypothetical protein
MRTFSEQLLPLLDGKIAGPHRAALPTFVLCVLPFFRDFAAMLPAFQGKIR